MGVESSAVTGTASPPSPLFVIFFLITLELFTVMI